MLRACSNNNAGFLRTEMTPLASEITLHTKYDELTDCFEFRVAITQQFWLAKYASINMETSFLIKHMADIPDLDVKM